MINIVKWVFLFDFALCKSKNVEGNNKAIFNEECQHHKKWFTVRSSKVSKENSVKTKNQLKKCQNVKIKKYIKKYVHSDILVEHIKI